MSSLRRLVNPGVTVYRFTNENGEVIRRAWWVRRVAGVLDTLRDGKVPAGTVLDLLVSFKLLDNPLEVVPGAWYAGSSLRRYWHPTKQVCPVAGIVPPCHKFDGEEKNVVSPYLDCPFDEAGTVCHVSCGQRAVVSQPGIELSFPMVTAERVHIAFDDVWGVDSLAWEKDGDETVTFHRATIRDYPKACRAYAFTAPGAITMRRDGFDALKDLVPPLFPEIP